MKKLLYLFLLFVFLLSTRAQILKRENFQAKIKRFTHTLPVSYTHLRAHETG